MGNSDFLSAQPSFLTGMARSMDLVKCNHWIKTNDNLHSCDL